ncbi:MAG: mannose-1-phosphate guanylyltransferase [Phycisphaerales bacterium]|jgi:mannose-1-phosphate guanylyltransferase|nr:mannose-1-phosphate guanylyltransferase [Phycisphaerales bacterium]MBT7171152.1 mannose-1-phosphate guanylyltransferase [Phycisphaerales bacterium]
MAYAVILAGGSGKRLWPMSRTKRPKQILPLLEGKSLLTAAVERLDGLFEPEEILVVTSQAYMEEVRACVPGIPEENLIAEPCQRNTAAAIGYAAHIVNQREPGATMAIFTADHMIRPVECFVDSVRKAISWSDAMPDSLITFGIRPTWPHTGLGYVETGEMLEAGVYRSRGFCEKPDHAQARRYIESGRFFWNSGMFVWKVETILKKIEEFLPDTADKLSQIRDAMIAGEEFLGTVENLYPELEKISIDYAVLERADDVLAVELKCEWIDLGDWPALEELLEADEAGNTLAAGHTVMLDSFGNVIVSDDPDHLVATLGIDDSVIVHTHNATLICKKTDSQRLRALVEMVQEKYGERYL